MTAIQADGKPYHIMFMPCSNWIKYEQRFKRLNWYMGKHRPDLTSGLYDTVICDARKAYMKRTERTAVSLSGITRLPVI